MLSELGKDQLHLGGSIYCHAGAKKIYFFQNQIGLCCSLDLQIQELKKYSKRTSGCGDIKCLSPGNQQLWQQLFF